MAPLSKLGARLKFPNSSEASASLHFLKKVPLGRFKWCFAQGIT